MHDSPHSPPSATASHPRSVGNGHTQACDRFECSRPRTRLYPAVSMVPRNGRNACHILSLWCDVVRGRSTEREAASHHGAGSRAGSTHRVERIESTNQIGSHGRVHLSNRIFTAHTNLPVFYYKVSIDYRASYERTSDANASCWTLMPLRPRLDCFPGVCTHIDCAVPTV